MIDIESTNKNNVKVGRVTGVLDAVTSTEFEQACGRAIAAVAQTLIVEVSQLRYVSGAGLRVILSVAKALHGKGGTLRLAGLGGMEREVFEVSGFSGLFSQPEWRESATAAW